LPGIKIEDQQASGLWGVVWPGDFCALAIRSIRPDGLCMPRLASAKLALRET
jgi:hypothetical protein